LNAVPVNYSGVNSVEGSTIDIAGMWYYSYADAGHPLSAVVGGRS